MIHRRCVWIYHARLIIRKGKTGMKKGCPAGVWSGGKSRAGFISSRFLPAPCQSFCRRHVTQKMCLWIFFTPLSFPRAFRSIAFPHQNGSQRRVKSSVWQDTLYFFSPFSFYCEYILLSVLCFHWLQFQHETPSLLEWAWWNKVGF